MQIILFSSRFFSRCPKSMLGLNIITNNNLKKGGREGRPLLSYWVVRDGRYYLIKSWGTAIIILLGREGRPLLSYWVVRDGRYYLIESWGTAVIILLNREGRPLLSYWVVRDGRYYLIGSWGTAVIILLDREGRPLLSYWVVRDGRYYLIMSRVVKYVFLKSTAKNTIRIFWRKLTYFYQWFIHNLPWEPQAQGSDPG